MSNPVLLQLPVLLGVGVGALATYATTSLGERTRWRRERNVRWDTARMQAYAAYGDAAKRVLNIAVRMAVARGLPHTVEPLASTAKTTEALGTAEDERARAWEAVLLLGDPETVAAARTWHEQIWRLVWFGLGRLTEASQWPSALRETEEARDKFYECARQDLGVQGDAVPTPPRPPQWMHGLVVTDAADD